MADPAQIRTYNPETDYEAMKAVLVEAELFDEDYESPEKLARWVDIQPDAIMVATVDDEVVGSIYFQDGIIPHIFRLAVRSDFRKKGIGTQLLQEAEQRARDLGHEFMELFIAPGHPERIEWYSNRGWDGRVQYTDMVRKL